VLLNQSRIYGTSGRDAFEKSLDQPVFRVDLVPHVDGVHFVANAGAEHGVLDNRSLLDLKHLVGDSAVGSNECRLQPEAPRLNLRWSASAPAAAKATYLRSR
jgi:hypothetical protein